MWHPQFGDRVQRLVFIGKEAILPEIREELEKCLLTQSELNRDASYLKEMKDPFGDWSKAIQMAQSETEGEAQDA